MADSFFTYLQGQVGRDDAIGTFARMWVRDVEDGCARRESTLSTMDRHLIDVHRAPELVDVRDHVFREYRWRRLEEERREREKGLAERRAALMANGGEVVVTGALIECGDVTLRTDTNRITGELEIQVKGIRESGVARWAWVTERNFMAAVAAYQEMRDTAEMRDEGQES